MTTPDSDPRPPQGRDRRRWRDDPLSVMLVVAAVLLGVMYFLEQQDLRTIEAGSERARALGAGPLDLEGCIVEAAGLEARQLVVACRTRPPDSVREELSGRLAETPLADFDEIVILGEDRRLSCPTEISAWPEACETIEPSDPATKATSRLESGAFPSKLLHAILPFGRTTLRGVT